MAIQESDLLAADLDRSGADADRRSRLTEGDREGSTSTELELTAEQDVQLAIQTIASRILAASLIERAQEAESIAT